MTAAAAPIQVPAEARELAQPALLQNGRLLPEDSSVYFVCENITALHRPKACVLVIFCIVGGEGGGSHGVRNVRAQRRAERAMLRLEVGSSSGGCA